MCFSRKKYAGRPGAMPNVERGKLGKTGSVTATRSLQKKRGWLGGLRGHGNHHL